MIATIAQRGKNAVIMQLKPFEFCDAVALAIPTTNKCADDMPPLAMGETSSTSPVIRIGRRKSTSNVNHL